MKKINGKLIAKDLAEIALFVALMVAGAYVSIPFYPVPLTFQTVTGVLAGLLLGYKKGALAMFIYAFMGTVCFIPVFSDHSLAGFAYVLKPSFGYIIGFIFSAFVAGIIIEKGKSKPLWRYILATVAAFLTDYLIGMPYFAIVWKYVYGGEQLVSTFILYNVLYLPKDLLLSVLAGILANRLTPVLTKKKMNVDTEQKI